MFPVPVIALLRRYHGRDAEFYRLVREMFGIRARNIELYKLALMHRSASVELADGTPLNNERLEYLGDAILEAIVSDFLFIEFPRATEGELTRLRSKIVSRSTLNALAEAIGLDHHIIHHTGGHSTRKNAGGDALEAMIGAIYLDRGYNRANRAIIDGLFRRHLDHNELLTSETDYKSRLIERCQRNRQTVRFATTPDKQFTNGRPLFRAGVMIDGIEVGHGVGETKKEAEQHASLAVWNVLSDEAGDLFLDNIDMLSKKNEPSTAGASSPTEPKSPKGRVSPRSEAT
jgi:ribonuclease-3